MDAGEAIGPDTTIWRDSELNTRVLRRKHVADDGSRQAVLRADALQNGRALHALADLDFYRIDVMRLGRIDLVEKHDVSDPNARPDQLGHGAHEQAVAGRIDNT